MHLLADYKYFQFTNSIAESNKTLIQTYTCKCGNIIFLNIRVKFLNFTKICLCFNLA